MKIRDVDTGRMRHSVAEAGSGEPLLLVHGFTGAKEDFADFLDGFADRGWHVVAPDLRGHGASDQPAEEDAYSLAHMTDDVLALVDALGWERFDLLGHSMGGMVAQLAALREPERLRSLVLMDTAPGPSPGLPTSVRDHLVGVARTEGVDALAATIAELTSAAGVLRPAEERVRASRPGYVEFTDRKLHSVAPAMFAAMATQLPRADDRLMALGDLDVRTLVVVGEEDEGFLGASERLAATIPDAALEVIPEAAHSPQFENPDRWWKVVTRFLEAGRPVPAP